MFKKQHNEKIFSSKLRNENILLTYLVSIDNIIVTMGSRNIIIEGDGFITILEVIKDHYKSFSRLHIQLADYITANLIDAAFMNINELSAKAGVSTATITRFVKTLGYSSFVEFQGDIKAIAKKEIAPIKEFKYYVKEEPVKNVLYDQIQDSVAALEDIYNEVLEENLEQAAKCLSQARKIYIVASRSSFSMAYYCYFSLKRFQENVYLIENRNDDLSIHLQYVTHEDVLLAISYPLYTKFTVDVVRFFAEKKCNITCITDSYISPLAEYADNLLIVKNRLKTYFVTTIAVINALIITTSKNNPQSNIAMFAEENEITTQLDVYVKK